MTLARLVGDRQVELSCDEDEPEAHLLLLQGRPLHEPVFQSGPYVASSREEMLEVMQEEDHDDWPWGRLDPVHPRSEVRFYRIKDGPRCEPPHQA